MWLGEHPFHRRALYIAERLGGGDWWMRYAAGDASVINAVCKHFAMASRYYSLPENRPALTQEQLVDVAVAAGLLTRS